MVNGVAHDALFLSMLLIVCLEVGLRRLTSWSRGVWMWLCLKLMEEQVGSWGVWCIMAWSGTKEQTLWYLLCYFFRTISTNLLSLGLDPVWLHVQTEAEPEVGSLLDDLGLRDKQQFVSTFCGSWMFLHCPERHTCYFVDLLCVSHILTQEHSSLFQPISQKKRYIVRNGVPVMVSPTCFLFFLWLLLLHVIKCSCLIYDADMFSICMLDTNQSHSVGH